MEYKSLKLFVIELNYSYIQHGDITGMSVVSLSVYFLIYLVEIMLKQLIQCNHLFYSLKMIAEISDDNIYQLRDFHPNIYLITCSPPAFPPSFIHGSIVNRSL